MGPTRQRRGFGEGDSGSTGSGVTRGGREGKRVGAGVHGVGQGCQGDLVAGGATGSYDLLWRGPRWGKKYWCRLFDTLV